MSNPDHIAIVGVSCSLPGAHGVDQYASLLAEGRDAFERVCAADAQKTMARGIDPNSPDWVGVNAPLQNAERFDADLFGYTRREVEVMDPQQRVAMQCAYAALEDAAIQASSVDHSVGVYLACSPSTFLFEYLSSTGMRNTLGVDALALVNHADFIATAISYRLDLRGPSMGIQTACSGSLVAVHSACEALRSAACDLALAGGVSVRMPQRSGYQAPVGGVASPSGACRPFAEDADGTVFGSGAGFVVLQRLDDALAMGSRILGVVSGSAVNNDGRARAGFTAPSQSGQAAVIAEALGAAGLSPGDITYVEGHGTGTLVGDQIELRALADVYGGSVRRQPLIVGSCKGNIGHVDVAAGIAGLVKVILALRHKTLYPTLGKGVCAAVAGSGFELDIIRETRGWPAGAPRRAGVSSFGIGGTNAHVIVEEPPMVAPVHVRSDDRARLITLSAATPEAISSKVRDLSRLLEQSSGESLADIAYTLHTGRESLRFRINVAAQSRHAAALALRQTVATHSIARPCVVFLVPGHDEAVLASAKAMYTSCSLFKAAFIEVALLFTRCSGPDILAMVERTDGSSSEGILMAFAYALALADTLACFAITPDAVIGHGAGELAGAVLAGVIDREQGVAAILRATAMAGTVAVERSISVSLSAAAVRERLVDGLRISALDGRLSNVVSGLDAPLKAFCEHLDDLAMPWTPLQNEAFCTDGAVCKALAGFELTGGVPDRAWISPVAAKIINAGERVEGSHWKSLAARPQDWLTAMERLEEHFAAHPGAVLMIDLGPSDRLGSMAQRVVGAKLLPWRKPSDPVRTGEAWLLALLGVLHSNGLPLDFEALYSGEKRARVALPSYPFATTAYLPAQEKTVEVAVEPAVCIRQMAWRKEARPIMLPSTGERQWLVLVRDPDDTLVAQLRATGASVVLAQAGDSFEQRQADHFVIRPGQFEDIAAVLATAPFTDIVHHWSYGEEGPDERERGVVGGFAMLRAFNASSRTGPSRVFFVTQRALDAFCPQPVIPARSALGALARVAVQEMPGIRCVHVDVDNDQDALASLFCERPHPRAAIRAGHPFTPVFAPLELESQAPSLLVNGGVYVITGGTGRFAMIIGQLLVREYAAKVIAFARGITPATEALSAGFDIQTVDIGNREAVFAAFDAVRERYGRIDGVFHAAGVVATQLHQPIDEMDNEQLREHFDARVDGFNNVHDATRSDSGALKLLASSMSPILGGLGLAAYSAAHTWIDAAADASDDWRAIHWEGWFRAPTTGAQSVDAAADRGPSMLSDDEVRTYFLAALKDSTPRRIIVTRHDLESRLAKWVTRPAVFDSVQALPAMVSVRDELIRIISSLIGVEPGDDDDFFDLGVNSLVVVQVLARLRASLGIDVPLRALFDYPSVALLCAEIESMRQGSDSKTRAEH
ncbi:type I polyketide synthase [Pseudomonas lactis]|uniref:type I polyketide synthase n=1 Tax=Pseudomonas lactis TaxID=1615674 RepID=UPI0013DED6F9|nr:type I polyketide synthase [Pseudomonas lactis]